MSTKPILVFGVPRSGSTWTSKVLSHANHTQLIMEPDNESMNIMALIGKRNYPQIPYIHQKEHATCYFDLWQHIFGTNFLYTSALSNKILRRIDKYYPDIIEKHLQNKSVNKSNITQHEHNRLYYFVKKVNHFYKFPTHLRKVVKTVHAGLCIEFLYKHFTFQPLIIFRHPANVVASCSKLNLNDGNRYVFLQERLHQNYLQEFQKQIEALTSPISLMAAQVGIHYYIWETLLKKYPSWIMTYHEELCDNPMDKFYELFADLNLQWTNDVESFIQSSNQSGSGFSIYRETNSQVDKWKGELTSKQIEEVKKGYGIFPLKSYQHFLHT